MISTTNIFSLNVNGLRNVKKRGLIFNWLQRQDADIFFLQDVHCDELEDDIEWTREWGGIAIW